MVLSRAKRRSNIRKALARVRAARGGVTGFVAGSGSVKGFRPPPRITFRDASGKVVNVVQDGKSKEQVIAEHNAKVTRIAKVQIGKEQRNIAVKKIGSIRSVVRRGNEITYIGAGGKSFTFPKGGLTFSGREKFGGVISTEVALKKLRERGTAFRAKRLEQKIRPKLVLKEKKVGFKMLARPEGRRKPTPKRQVVDRETRLKELQVQRKARDIRKLEEQTARRLRRIPDLAKVIPGLRGDNFGQQVVRNIITAPIRIPTELTIGTFVTARNAGLKAGLLAEARQVSTLKQSVKEEQARALRKTPATIASSFDPTTPEGFTNILDTILLFKLASVRGKATPAKTSTTLRGTAKTVAKKSPGAARAVNALSKNKGFISRLTNSINRAKAKIKAKKFVKSTKRATAREIVRKLDTNRRLLSSAKKNLAKLKKAKATRLIKKEIRRINAIKSGSKTLNNRLNNLGFPRGARVRLLRESRKVTKPKLPRAKRARKFEFGLKKRVREIPKAKAKQIIRSIDNELKSYGVDIKGVTKQGIKNLKKADILVKRFNRRVGKLANKQVVAAFRKLRSEFNKLDIELKGQFRLGKKQVKGTFREAKTSVKNELRFIRDSLNNDLRPILKNVKVGIRKGKSFKRKTTNILRKRLKKEIAKGKGVLNSEIKRLIVLINKKTPFIIRKVKPLGRGARRRVAKAKRRFARQQQFKGVNIDIIIRNIRKGKIKFSSLPKRIKKQVRKRFSKTALSRAEINFRRLIRKVRNTAKSNKTKLEKRRELAKLIRERNKLKNDFVASEKLVSRLRKQKILDDLAKASKIAKALKLQLQGKRVIGVTPKKPIAPIKPQDIKPASSPQAATNAATKEVTSGSSKLLTKKPVTKKTVNQAKQQMGRIQRAKTKGKAKAETAKAVKAIGNKQTQVLKLVKKNPTKVNIAAGKSQLRVLALLLGAVKAVQRQKFKRGTPGIIKPITEQSQKQEAIQEQKQDQPQKEIIKEETIIITDQRIDTLSKQRQAAIINSILLTVLGTGALLTGGGRRIITPQTRTRGGIAKLRKRILNRIRKKKFVFTPDIFSIIFGIRAKPGQRIKLLKPGRFFTGLERRPIVK